MSKATFSVDGLHCQGCVHTVEQTLSALADVHSVTVDLDMRGVSAVTVDADREIRAEEVQKALDTTGNFTVV
ncbi:heavy-metal-associated domain-containing protein [Nocardia pseudobrasiliensis]|uniref:Copper chaperone CopZ n=1 Tax=Nocardia pseudobrasiliensis TaxID=45979 RepID=A0A370HWJ1_9NOCA|nr:heavy metal-associated domain-containing protein [Nocardia pseudobrasiliensis]RDI61324.1 copper chaperone CopZ [Nocardia pseudobrasiliensis]